MTRKDKSTELLLTQNYISKSTIMQVLGCSFENAKEVFTYVKRLELEKAPVIMGNPIDVRPHRVPSKLFMKVMNIDYGLTKKQYEVSMTLKGGGSNATI